MIHTVIQRKITAVFCGLVLSGAMLVSATVPAYAASLANTPSSPVIVKTVSNGTVVSPAPPPELQGWKGPSMAMPSAGAPMAEWEQWAAEQRSAIQATPFAQQLAAQGYKLITPVYYVPVGQIPGSPIPKGIVTYAAAFTVAPIARGTVATGS
jgi:hypothetical protein